MPYLPKHKKGALEPHLTNLSAALVEWSRGLEDNDALAEVGGLLNYIFNRLALDMWLNVVQEGRYAHLERLMGTFESAKLEFWRRVVVPYEEEARRRNGDVFTDES